MGLAHPGKLCYAFPDGPLGCLLISSHLLPSWTGSGPLISVKPSWPAGPWAGSTCDAAGGLPTVPTLRCVWDSQGEALDASVTGPGSRLQEWEGDSRPGCLLSRDGDSPREATAGTPGRSSGSAAYNYAPLMSESWLWCLPLQ